MKMSKITTYSLLGGMGVVTLSAIMVSSAGASQKSIQVDADRSERPIMNRFHGPEKSPLLELFGLDREEYIDLLRDDVSLREYADSQNINLEEIRAEAESRIIDHLDDALDRGRLTQDEYDEKVNALSDYFEARFDAEDLEDLPRFEKRMERRQEKRGDRQKSNAS